jgi:long-chain acyl-CoA synthetase
MHPSHHAAANPEKPAYVMAYSGETVTYGELDARSNQGAHLFRSLGLQAGDSVALFIDNHPRYYEILWACPALRPALHLPVVEADHRRGRVHREGLRGEGPHDLGALEVACRSPR